MEGLLIAEELAKLTPLLPSGRSSWRFPDSYTFVLPLSEGALWLYNRPPNARAAYKKNFPAIEKSHSGFQDLLVSKASGDLTAIEQVKLDRVFKLYFAAQEGFVSTEPVVFIVELTGRNCNLILTNTKSIILGAARSVNSEINRHRQVHSGLTYISPPPYQKLDPRSVTGEKLHRELLGKQCKQLRKIIDGIGPDLTRTLITKLNLSNNHQLTTTDIDKLVPILKELSKQPSKMMRETLGLLDVKILREQEAKAVQLVDLRKALFKKQTLLEKRIKDIERSSQAALEADNLRNQANLLLAHQKILPNKVSAVELIDFTGQPLVLKLNPKLSAIENAEAIYERARKLEQRKTQAESREDSLLAEVIKVDEIIASLDKLSLREIAELSKTYVKKTKEQFRAEPFIHYQSPQDYNVLVGRNSKGNDYITFRLAKSQDIWLHVQGYTGSHVIIQAQKKEVPFATILFAAQLAAAYSKAANSDNVAVDYTFKKNVWKVKGMPLGAVHFAQQKTVYITPNRYPEGN